MNWTTRRGRTPGDETGPVEYATMDVVGVRRDCRHYSVRTLPTGDQVERCRLEAAQAVPFACPDDCLFYEKRSISSAGWQIREREDRD